MVVVVGSLAATLLIACSDGGHPDALDATDATDSAPLDAPMDAPIPGALGARCTVVDGGAPSGSCERSLVCLTDWDGFPRGYCSPACDPVTPCPMRSACSRRGTGGQCFGACGSDRDCRTIDGYHCIQKAAGARICAPVESPLGLRDGRACFDVGAGSHALPALPRTTFNVPNVSATAARTDATWMADGNVARNPARDAIALPYIAVGATSVFIGSSSLLGGTTVVATGSVRDPAEPLVADPSVAYSRDGALQVAFMAYRLNGLTAEHTHIWNAASADDGAAWGTPRRVDPDDASVRRVDKPWIAIGRSPTAPADDLAYVVYAVEGASGARELRLQSSRDAGRTWGTPTVVAAISVRDGVRRMPQLAVLAVSVEGVLHLAYFEIPVDRVPATLWGDAQNRIVWRSSADAAMTWSDPVVVSRATMDTPVYVQPAIAASSTALHVAYVTGLADGAWDVVLATSRDGGRTFVHRRVNDEPERCATHTLPSLVLDEARRRVHVVWLENRFGDGAAVYANCPEEPSLPCGSNEAVSDRPFVFSTTRDVTRWHGDYGGIALAPDGSVWAGWSDTRTRSPAMYLAHGVPR